MCVWCVVGRPQEHPARLQVLGGGGGGGVSQGTAVGGEWREAKKVLPYLGEGREVQGAGEGLARCPWLWRQAPAPPCRCSVVPLRRADPPGGAGEGRGGSWRGDGVAGWPPPAGPGLWRGACCRQGA